MTPSKEEAHQFALMLQSGLPGRDAITYFFPDEGDSQILASALKQWLASPSVKAAIVKLQGKSWQDMTLDERIQTAIDLHYNQLATFLYSHNYCELMGADRQKADICRAALEAKIAGNAGKMGPIESFWSDVKSGRVKLSGLPA